MYKSVQSIFCSFTTKYEGFVPWMYLDVKGLVTIGVGNLIDPMSAALKLPFIHMSDHELATSTEIISEWKLIKSHIELANQGSAHAYQYCKLVLKETSIYNIVHNQNVANEIILKTIFPDWNNWPADAQLGVLSMAWALGAGFPNKWPKFMTAAKTKNWIGCASECKIKEEKNPGIVPRNKMNYLLFMTAAEVQSHSNLDKSIIHLFEPHNTRPPDPIPKV